jgi:membrane-associated phospholipid phosphatase
VLAIDRRRRALVPALLAAATVSAAGAARAEPEPLRVAPAWDATLIGAGGALALVLALPLATPRRCLHCGAGELDETVREALAWRHPAEARRASDLLANGVIPAAALATSAASAWRAGAPSAFWTDALVLVEVVSVSTGLDAISKDAFARRRPEASLTARGAADESFYSGHTSVSFALAVGAGTIASLRGYPSAPWVWGTGIALASGVGYLRVAGDAHWATDVLAGAAAGGLVGFALPWFLHRTPRGRRRLRVSPAPGGVAIAF